MANRRIIDDVLSSTDDEIFLVYRRPKVVRRRIHHFQEFDYIDFPARFRLSKESVCEVLRQIRHELEHRREQNHAIFPMNHLLLTLRFYATGSHLISAGDFSGVSKTSAHRIVHKVTAAIARLWPHYIKFPTMPNEIKHTQLKFFNIARFPRVLGSLDCTHVKIQSLGGNDAEVFRNRKGYFSINVQAICNANLEFSDIVARWPGSVHDCKIFNNSRIRALFEADTFGDGLLVGDSGYQLRSYIMTPLGNPRTRSEQLYNESLIRTRNTIERTFGVWKKRVTVLGVLLGILEWDRTVPCILLLWEYVLGYLALFIASMTIEFSICILATRGSILDTAARAPMQHLLYIRLSLLLVETGWLCAGVAWLVHYYQTCPVDQAKDVILGLVISNWCILASVMVTVWCTYDAAGRSWVKMKKYQRSMREAESRGGGRMHYKRSGSRNRNWRQRKVIRAYQDSWDNRCRLLFCCMGNSDRNRNSFTDIARLLSDFFRDLDVVPSDVVAGLVLLRKFQKIERELIVKQKKNDTYEFLSGVPVTPRTKFLSLTEDGDLGHFQSTIHYMHFALAAYGWPLFLINHTTGLCQLCTRLRCGCFPCVKHDDDATIVADNCCQCNYAALRRMIEIGEVEVIYATFHVDVGETPFFVALDYTRKKVVVSIRGTLSMKDVVTDLNAEAEVLPLTPPREDWLGHKGMVQAAEYIRKKISEEAIITKALAKNPDRGTHQFGLTLVGHSLGAGTAAILAILLRQEFPDLVCFSFAPPGGLLSMPAQQYTQEFITSVVVGKDVVPRIGLRQLESLRADLINAIKRSVDPKWKTIACSVMCCGCGSMPTSAANLEAGGCISEYQRDKDQAREQTIVPSDSSIALTLHTPLYPPGRIIHVVRHHPNKGEQVLRKREPVYQALWADPCDFDEVLISPVMIQDHMPDNMLKALNKVVTTLGPAKPQRLASGSSAEASEAFRETNEIQEIEIEQEMRALLSPPSPAKCGALNAGTPPHRLCLETSFTSLQSPTEFPQAGRELSIDSHGLPWEYVSLASELLNTPRPDENKLSNHPLDWDCRPRIAPLATPETMSESSSNPPSPVPPPRPMRRTPKIPGNLSMAADDLKSNLHFAMLSAKNYCLREDIVCSNSSSGNSEASYESARSLQAAGLPPPVPRRRDSVTVRSREHPVCTAACCQDDGSEKSTPSSDHSTRMVQSSHRVQIDFRAEDNDTNGSSLEFYEAKSSSGQRDSNNDVFLSVRSSPECKGLMAPATDLGAEWKKRLDPSAVPVDASLPLLRGLSPTPTHGQHSNSPFFNVKRKKYVYPITLVGRGESSV